jgi:hypothetical protein
MIFKNSSMNNSAYERGWNISKLGKATQRIIYKKLGRRKYNLLKIDHKPKKEV